MVLISILNSSRMHGIRGNEEHTLISALLACWGAVRGLAWLLGIMGEREGGRTASKHLGR